MSRKPQINFPLISFTDTLHIGGRHAQIDEDRFILADRHGLLCILGLTRSGPGGTVSSISVAELGQVRRIC